MWGGAVLSEDGKVAATCCVMVEATFRQYAAGLELQLLVPDCISFPYGLSLNRGGKRISLIGGGDVDRSWRMK